MPGVFSFWARVILYGFGLIRALQVAREDLRLNRAFIIHPGQKSYPLNEWVEALSLPEARTRVQAMTTRAN